MAVAGLALVAPLESGLLPGRLGGVLGPPAAEAQTPPPPPLVDGTPDPCPAVTGWLTTDGWTPADPTDPVWPTASECVLRVPACPVSEVRPRQLMSLSYPAMHTMRVLPALAWTIPPGNYGATGQYPEFCEDVVQRGADPVGYGRCSNLRGHVVFAPIPHMNPITNLPDEACRALRPIACPTLEVTRSDGTTLDIATNRIGSQICGAVLRRSWTCPTTEPYEPLNAFNRCFLPTQPFSQGSHPACGPGAPAFPLGGPAACEEYVGADFLQDPTGLDCRQLIVSLDPVAGNDHWCRYNPWQLRAECFRNVGRPADCSGPQAFCIKRASRAGGCDQIGQTILCRLFQENFAQNPAATVEVFQQLGAGVIRNLEEISGVPHAVCNPCQQLPFSAGPTDRRCASTTRSRPLSPNGTLERVLAVKRDFPATRARNWPPASCRTVASTADYDANAGCRDLSVCADPPSGRATWTSDHPSGLAIVNSAVTVSVVDIPIATRTERILTMQDRTGFILTSNYLGFPYFVDVPTSDRDALTRPTTIYLGNNQYNPNSLIFGRPKDTECTMRGLPYFDLIVEELWPDYSGDEIRALFGADSLQSWDALPTAEQQALTEARGLEWLGGSFTDMQVDARRAALTVQIECVGNNPWQCDWTPTRSGYFKLTAAGAWEMSETRLRQWKRPWVLGSTVNVHLQRPAVRQQIQQWLDNNGLTASDLGLGTDGTGEIDRVLGVPAGCDFSGFPLYLNCVGHQLNNQFEPFREDNVVTASCGWGSAIDFRVQCGSGENYNYTETEAVGVMVHEVRTNTVMPSG